MQLFKSNAVKSAIISINTLLFTAFIIASLYFGHLILMPLALAILLAFLFSPLLSIFERYVGRVLATMLMVILTAIVVGFVGYVISKEFIRFGSDLPIYKKNIETRVQSFRAYEENLFKTSSTTLQELKTKFTGQKLLFNGLSNIPIDSTQLLMNLVEKMFGSVISIILNTILVAILVIFILIDREDLRGRIIRILGQERIGATTYAMDDAGKRVSRYLRMFLVINIIYGTAVAIGLFLLGIPNAILWGALSAIFRFIPYVGVWIAATIPIALSFLVSTYWFTPIMTISLFIISELICFNVLEPWLYGSITGVSSTALIIAALFWTLLWGPVGLILSTPLTVCMIVLGRYVPRLEFLSVLLSDEEPLTHEEEYYHLLLSSNFNEILQFTDDYLKNNSLISLYDNVFIPAISRAEKEKQNEILDDEQTYIIEQNLLDTIEDLGSRSVEEHKLDDKSADAQVTKDLVLCLAVKARRDELAGEMLIQLLRQKSINSLNVSAQLKLNEIIDFIESSNPKIVVISVVSPSTIIQARFLSRKLHLKFPQIKIMVGLWGYSENLIDVNARLKTSGTDFVVKSLEDAVDSIEDYLK